MDYKYTTKFDLEITASSIDDLIVSQASLSELEPLVPHEIDFDKNIDLLGISFNAAVVNSFNKNGDGINSETATKHINQFIHKPTNIEHNKERVIGHIVKAGFSEYGTNKIIDAGRAKKMNGPYNIALGAVVYKSVNKEFAELIEITSNPEDKGMYGKISASWEIGFSSYVLAVGSKNLKDAKIIDDPEMIREMEGMLSCYGGCGKTKNGEPVYRLITGDIYPLGIGYTSNPAADVKGVYKKNKKTSNANDNSDKISQKQKINVKERKNTAMDIENLVSELKDLLVEKKFSEETAASMTKNFHDAIRESDEKYRNDIEAAKSEKEALAKEQEDLKSSLKELQEKLSEANDRISSFENEKKAEEAVARFNERMEKLDSEFDLEKEDREFLASEIKCLDETDQSFASYCEKLNVLWKNKSKASKAEREKEIQERIEKEIEKRISEASADGKVSIEKLLDKTKEEEGNKIPNSNESTASENDSLVEKFKKSFSKDSFSISR